LNLCDGSYLWQREDGTKVLFYAEGPFIMATNLADDPSDVAFQFEDSVKQLLVVGRKVKYMLALFGKCSIGIIELGVEALLVRTCRLAFVHPSLEASRLISGGDNGDTFCVLSEFNQGSHLVRVESVGVFARLSDEILSDRLQQQKAILLYSFPPEHTVHDAQLLTTDSLVSVGSNPTMAWWSTSSKNANLSTPDTKSSSLTIRAFDRLGLAGLKSPPPVDEPQLIAMCKFNEPDRTLNRIVFVSSRFVGCEDYKHGRLLVFDSKEGLLVRILKGYRCTSALVSDDCSVHLLSLNRRKMERFRLPFDPVAAVHVFGENMLSASMLNGSNLLVQSSDRLELYELSQAPPSPCNNPDEADSCVLVGHGAEGG